jgi:hypothetical protein
MRKKRKLHFTELTRSPRLEEVQLEDLKDDSTRVTDGHFVKLYQSYASGKLTAIFTRIDIEQIIPGVFLRSSDGLVTQHNFSADDEHVSHMAYEIRCGLRPALYLYKGIFGDSVGRFVCSDDVLLFHAYRHLGIKCVPAVLLGKPSSRLNESGICVRARNGRVKFESTIAVERTHAPSFLGDNRALADISPLQAIEKLRRAAESACACIKAFHIGAKSAHQVHYHQTIHSVAYRLAEALKAIELLLKNDLAYQVRPLVRSTYELFLNFYMDWLSPHHMGLVLQGVAALATQEKGTARYEVLDKAIRNTFGGLADICKNAAEKGRLSPLGQGMHESIYAALSPVVHQSFSVTGDYIATLDSGVLEPMALDELRANVRWLDVVAAAMIPRLLDDVGSSDGRPKEWPKLQPSRLRLVDIRKSDLPMDLQ